MHDPVMERRKHGKVSWRKKIAVRAAIEAGLSEGQAAKLVGVAPSTAHAIRVDPELSPDNVQRFKDIAPARFYQKVHLALDHITPESFSRMNALQTSIAAKVNLQAAREAEGLPSHTILVKRVAINLQGELASLRSRKERLLASLGGSPDDLHDVLPKGNVVRVREQTNGE